MTIHRPVNTTLIAFPAVVHIKRCVNKASYIPTTRVIICLIYRNYTQQQSIFLNFENNPIPVPILDNSNTCIRKNATSTPFTQCPTPFPTFAGAHGFDIGQISNSNINFHFQQYCVVTSYK